MHLGVTKFDIVYSVIGVTLPVLSHKEGKVVRTIP